MSTNAAGVDTFKGRVFCELPANSGSYILGSFRLEVGALDDELNVTVNVITPTAGSIVNPTVSAKGSASFTDIPLSNVGGNSIKVRYFKTPSEMVTLGVTGAYVKGYQQ
jgi:hypothetical protein